MDDFSVDASEINKLAADLGDVKNNIGPYVNSAVQRTSHRISDAWEEKLQGSEYLPHLGGAVSYDVSVFQGFGVSVIESEIGFDKGRTQGPLGNISEFGSINNPGRGYGLASLEENQDDFDRGLAAAAEDAFKAARFFGLGG